jgi:hypothetical protein
MAFLKKKKPVVFPSMSEYDLHQISIETVLKATSPTARQILSSYSWLTDAAIRFLGSSKYGKLIGEGSFGSAFEATYKGKKYVLKVSIAQGWSKFAPKEGMIGAYLYAPQMETEKQRELAVPEFRNPKVKDNVDPYLHVADYYGMLVMRLGDSTEAFDAISRWKSPKIIVAELGRLTEEMIAGGHDYRNAVVIFHITEMFEGGDLESWSERVFERIDWRNDPRRALDVLKTAVHYFELAFYQVASTMGRIGGVKIGMAHGDLHPKNVFLRYVLRELASYIYLRHPEANVRDFFDGSDAVSNPPVVSDPKAPKNAIPLFALGDLGTSMIYPFGSENSDDIFPHLALDISTLALGMLHTVFATKGFVPRLPLGKLRSLKWDKLIAEMGIYAEAFHVVSSFLRSLSKFWIPSKPTEIFPGREPPFTMRPHSAFVIGDAEKYAYEVGKAEFVIKVLERQGREWVKLHTKPEGLETVRKLKAREIAPIKEDWLSRKTQGDVDDAIFLLMQNNALWKATVWPKFQKTVTDWTLANKFMNFQLDLIRSGFLVPQGLTVLSVAHLEETASKRGLARPAFKEGTGEFWKTQFAAGRVRGRTEEEEEEEEEELF